MKKIFFCLFHCCFSCICFAQNNNPQPPFANIYRRPNVHPYTFISPDSNAMDYQQMFYLQNKTEIISSENQKNKVQNNNFKTYNFQKTYNTIRPTGHKTYFMNLP